MQKKLEESEEKGLMEYKHGGISIEDASDIEVTTMLEDLSPYERIHLSDAAPGLFRMAEYHGIPEESYIRDSDLVIYVADQGYDHSRLSKEHTGLYTMIERRDLVDRIFPEIQGVPGVIDETLDYDEISELQRLNGDDDFED